MEVFSPFTDRLWLENGSILAKAGLPWYNNQINMPDEIDTSWPFHFKTFEQKVIREKGARIGDRNASGYVKRLFLSTKPLSQALRSEDGSIIASSVVAGGANHSNPSAAVALIPASLGGKLKQFRVAYIRASDAALAGSRDAIPPLWMAMQEIRFGSAGFRTIYQHCAQMRVFLLKLLAANRITATGCPHSLDIIIRGCTHEQVNSLVTQGGLLIGKSSGEIMLTLQPSVTKEDIYAVLEAVSPNWDWRAGGQTNLGFPAGIDFSSLYPFPKPTFNEIQRTVQSWRIATRSAAGYPFNMGPCAALGPVLANFLDVTIPDEWLQFQTDQILATRMRQFGLGLDTIKSSQFKGCLTNGSTMGNRLGIHAALLRLPGAFIYFSSETHYSVKKTVRDCDALTNKSTGRPYYSEVPCDPKGSMLPDALVEMALKDREYCEQRNEPFRVILFMNIGTTFVGARDDIKTLKERLYESGIEISHIHVDGAFDLGFDTCGIGLGAPGTVDAQGIPLVQGVTISHHKALGSIVCGEVLSYFPTTLPLLFQWKVDPRIVLETWLYSQVFTPADITTLYKYCRRNALHLEGALRKKAGFATKLNDGSTIVVLERPPSWIIEEFSLRPEGDWVHFITLPHISPGTIEFFVDRILSVKRQCDVAFGYVTPLLTELIQGPVRLKCLRTQDPIAKYVKEISARAVPLNSGLNDISFIADIAIQSGLRSALSVVALNEQDEPLAVLLIETNRDLSFRVGPLLVARQQMSKSEALVEIFEQLAGFMARHMKARLLVDESSYLLYIF
ncbi:hypothetical protein AA313_de0208855 [Arthrobotrys entomopaga]|nr:hypothetical protein AA313_de0208855 [Arthrobotrys entomopaga]